MRHLLLTIVLALALPGGPLAAQSSGQPLGPASLKADRIVYTSGYRVLRATGHVEVIFGTTVLTASALTFDEANNRIIADGPLRLTDGDNITFIANFAELSGDLQQAVLKSARMVLNRQLQLTAVQINRSEGRFTQLFQAAASTCVISTARPTPLWQVRARRIIHDEQKKVLYFERAQLRIAGVPVAYLPRLKLPDPSVKRASGFLVPGISSSDKLGFALAAPYFLTLGDYADVTLTPKLYSGGSATLGYKFRKRFHAGQLNLTGAVTRDNRSSHGLRAYLFADGKWRFRNGLQADFGLKFVSDTAYLRDHNLSDDARLDNRIALDRTTRRSQFSASVLGYRSLSAAVSNDTIPFLLTGVHYRHRFAPPVLGGQGGLSLGASSYQRRSTSNIVGRDGVRLSGVLDWQRRWISRAGLVVSTSARLRGDYYSVLQDSTYPNPLTRIVPLTALDLRLPMARRTARATTVIEPRLQLVWSPKSTVAIPNEDSQQVEFGPSSLFSLNRFSGSDRLESGFRANLGLTYSRRNASGLVFDGLIGKVFRLRDPGQFSAASGLSGTASSYVVAAQITLPSRLRMVQRMVLDNRLSIFKSETRLAYSAKKFDIDTSYLWLMNGVAGNVADRSEWQVNTGWNLTSKWRTQADWRYDLVAAAASQARVALTYRNECIKVDLSLSRSFASSSNVGASTNLGLKVTLDGFGGRASSADSGRRCRDF